MVHKAGEWLGNVESKGNGLRGKHAIARSEGGSIAGKVCHGLDLKCPRKLMRGSGAYMKEAGYRNAHSHLFLSVSLLSGYRSLLSHVPHCTILTAITLKEHSQMTIYKKFQNHEPKYILSLHKFVFSGISSQQWKANTEEQLPIRLSH